MKLLEERLRKSAQDFYDIISKEVIIDGMSVVASVAALLGVNSCRQLKVPHEGFCHDFTVLVKKYMELYSTEPKSGEIH
jgi:hypothetical protein